MENNHENSFWKQNNRAVPGRPSPKKEYKIAGGRAVRGGPMGSTSFQDFQESVQDAWDMGDDEFCIISGISGNHSKGSNYKSIYLLYLLFLFQILKYQKEYHIQQH